MDHREQPITTTQVFWDTDSNPRNPGWVMDLLPLGNIPFARPWYHLKRSADDAALRHAALETIRDEGYTAAADIEIEVCR